MCVSVAWKVSVCDSKAAIQLDMDISTSAWQKHCSDFPTSQMLYLHTNPPDAHAVTYMLLKAVQQCSKILSIYKIKLNCTQQITKIWRECRHCNESIDHNGQAPAGAEHLWKINSGWKGISRSLCCFVLHFDNSFIIFFLKTGKSRFKPLGPDSKLPL